MNGETISPTNWAQAAAALTGGGGFEAIPGADRRRPERSSTGAPPACRRRSARTRRLHRTIEHNVGDMTAIFQAGVPLARVRSSSPRHGQMLALDPPYPRADPDRSDDRRRVRNRRQRPLRHRYGQPRDLVLGMTFALSDGTIAKSGGRVIKNVAGYDLAKLFTGSFGTLGMILSVSVRLHPMPRNDRDRDRDQRDPDQPGAAASPLARAPLELDELSMSTWQRGLAAPCSRRSRRRAGAGPHGGRDRPPALRPDSADAALVVDDEPLWERQRAAQRSAEQAVVRVGYRPSEARGAVAGDRCLRRLARRQGRARLRLRDRRRRTDHGAPGGSAGWRITPSSSTAQRGRASRSIRGDRPIPAPLT